ncbi:PREDICTED: LOW QUALITY PROTEIN: cell division cycle-associated protein 2 [Lepidothrix coronata]|uniref:LOW QUALITY PROTEIN: cell division cycle-associated protein 2 n=1 Tax=Lepidothrix coronata TaxID=321398 RepID=A0A6J0IA40_9PASS|nr:PREDICTED: LOW QUALITY PROTEIN: cell division cycle-associated protein 2 [Lepidothrix coronata]
MHRQPKSPLKVKENEGGCLEEKDEASFPLPEDQKICKGTKFRVIRASKKENLSDGNQAWSPKRALKSPKGLEEELSHPEGDPGSCPFPGSCCGALQGDVGSEPTLPLNRKENFPGSRPGSLGNDSYSTPERDKAEGKPDLGASEELREKHVDFATVTITEFGIAPESFTKRCKGNSPTSLKFRRRSTIGLRGSPENNSLIRYLAQQRSKRQKEAFTQISPFKHVNVRSLKDKIETFQTSFESLQEAEGETGLSGLSHGDDSQEGGSSQNKVPFKKEPNLEQWSEKFLLDNSGADLKENFCRENVTRSSKCDLRICSILSPNPAVTEPAAPKEWVYGQKSPSESLETVAIGDTLERGHVFRSEPTPADSRVMFSDLSRKKVGFVAGLSLGMLEESKALATPPATPRQGGTLPFSDLTQSGSLRSILKKTLTRQLLDSPKEYLNDAVGRGGGEPVPVSYYEKTFEASETAENAENLDFKTPKKKKVTFGEVLSPEIFDQTLPANTPLRRGASPGLSCSPSPRPGLTAQPLPRLEFDCDDECVEPPQDFLETSFAAEDPPPVENAEAPADKADMVETRSSAKRKHRAESEQAAGKPSGATTTRNAEGTKNPRKNKIPRQKNPTTSAPKKPQRSRQTSYGKRRKRKVKKCIYGEREMASKKPLLSPIPEIPEDFSSVSSPDSPKAEGLFSEDAAAGNPKTWNACEDVQEKVVAEGVRGKSTIHAVDVDPSSKDLDVAAPSSSRDGAPQVSQGDLEAPSGTEQEVSNVVPDAEGGFDTSEGFQQGEDEAKESSSLTENEQLQGNLLGFLEQQATDVHEGAQRTQCPQTGSVSGSPARGRRRRSSSAIYFPPVENLEMTGIDLPVSSYNVEEVLCVPKGSFQPSRRKGSASGETRVRRSMRLRKEAGTEGLAWIQLPRELPEQPPLPAPAPKSRRRVSTSILAGSENVQPREQSPGLFPALGKENEDSAHRAHGPGRRRRSAPTPAETPWAQTQKRRITNSVNKKDRNNTKHSEEAEKPPEDTQRGFSCL